MKKVRWKTCFSRQPNKINRITLSQEEHSWLFVLMENNMSGEIQRIYCRRDESAKVFREVTKHPGSKGLIISEWKGRSGKIRFNPDERVPKGKLHLTDGIKQFEVTVWYHPTPEQGGILETEYFHSEYTETKAVNAALRFLEQAEKAYK